jgi:MGT family glycosyltransferase
MSKVIFFNIPAQGHINPSLPVISELVKRGEHVIYVNTEAVRQQAESSGATFVPYPDSSGAVPQVEALMHQAGNSNLARNGLSLLEIGERLLPFVFDLLGRERPDYVIYDSLAGWARQAAEKLNLRRAAVFATFAIGAGRDAMPPMSAPMMLNLVGQMVSMLPSYWQVGRRVNKQFGVKPLYMPLSNSGQINIVFTSVNFQPGGARFDSSYKFVGPSMAARPTDTDFPFDQLTRKPVIYISLGTINNLNLEFYRQCFAAFGDYPAQFILSAGTQTDLNALGTIPANFLVRNFVPQLEVLQKSDLFITHGGLNSVHEGLWYGVPLVVIPQQIEQALVAQQVVGQGAGVALGDKPPFGRITAAALRAAVEQVMRQREGYQAAAVKLGETLKAAGGYQRAADELIRLGSASNSI